MKRLVNNIVGNFGFDDVNLFYKSMFHSGLMTVTIPAAVLSATVERLFGLKVITLTAFIVLLIFELFTGVVASRVKGQRISSRRFSRFGFKLLTWIVFLFILNVFKNQYTDSLILSELFNWLHSAIVIYVSLEYLISILENIDTITGSDNSVLTRSLKRKIKSVLGEDEQKSP